jgi:magnesium-transporting ATPase (P-type)
MKRLNFGALFKIWILANVFLSIGVIIYLVVDKILNDYNYYRYLEEVLTIICIGFIFTLPNLIVLGFSNAIINMQKRDTLANGFNKYLMVILIINFIYLLVSGILFDIDYDEKPSSTAYLRLCLFFIGTTVAGVLAFYMVSKKVYKTKVINPEDLLLSHLDENNNKSLDDIKIGENR